MKVEVRSERSTDASAVARVHDLAFASPDIARQVRTIRASQVYRPDRSLVTENGRCAATSAS
jgi:predicted N-acetyltransferase YhbS